MTGGHDRAGGQGRPGGHGRAGEQVGSAAEEAARLLAAAEHWARGLAGEEHLATGSAECTVCPLCSAVGALRRVRPETAEHLLDAAGSLLAALRTAVAPTAARAGPDASPGVQAIRLDDEEYEQ